MMEGKNKFETILRGDLNAGHRKNIQLYFWTLKLNFHQT